MRINELLQQAKTYFPNSTSPILDMELLLCHVLKRQRSALYAWSDQIIDQEQFAVLSALIKRRQAAEPMAYILGYKEFWSLELKVTTDILIPRPETELLVETTLALLPAQTPCKIVDLGTGSGAIAIALAYERPQWHIIATDRSAAALAIARENAARYQLDNVEFIQSDWCTALPQWQFDAVVCNPPYIAYDEQANLSAELNYEPASALFADDDGLMAIKTIIKQAPAYLAPQGWLILEHGYQQANIVQALMQQAGYQNIHIYQDIAGLERVCAGAIC